MKKKLTFSWKADWPFLAVCVGALVLLLLFPALLGGKREDPYFSYKIMWLNYLGHRFKLPLETPKPLFAFLCGIAGQAALYPITCCFGAGVLGLLMKLFQKLGKPGWAGLVAFALFLVSNKIVLPEFILGAYWPLPFLFFTLAAVYFFVNTWTLATTISLLCAGLLRPEAWLFPPIFAAVALAKRDRSFSWWLFVPLLAPVIWALFDARISGSLTYSMDMTKYYWQTLGVLPVPFGKFWGATGSDLAANFYLPVHLAGLAGLGYFVIKTRRAEHLLMAVLAALPFLFFWLLSLQSPVITQVRFFAFPMLVLCFYAVLLLFDLSPGKWIAIALCCLLVCIGFRGDLVPNTVRMIQADRATACARAGTLETVRSMEKRAAVILCGRSAGYFAYQLGEKASQKIFMFREAATRPDVMQNVSTGVAVYVSNDLAGMDNVFRFLSRPQPYCANGFGFFPVRITSGGNGVVYDIERLPNATFQPSLRSRH
jgi:hypothetical protein